LASGDRNWRFGTLRQIQDGGCTAAGRWYSRRENGPSREAIVRAAIDKAKGQYGEPQFEKIVSVGDAVWDVWTAELLELPFVGIADEQRAGLLRDCGNDGP